MNLTKTEESEQLERYWDLQSKQILSELTCEEIQELKELDEKHIRKTLYVDSKASFIPEDEFPQSDF